MYKQGSADQKKMEILRMVHFSVLFIIANKIDVENMGTGI